MAANGGDCWPAVTTGGGSWTLTTTTGTSYVYPGTFAISSGGYSVPPPRTPTTLEWLDAEVESVCKLAR